MQNTERITQAELKRLLKYDPLTGIFTWAIARGKMRIGDVAGRKGSSRYIQIGIHGVLHYAHRLAWLYMTGKHSTGPIDHIDGDKQNNSFVNLREVTRSENQQNRQLKAQCNSRSGLLGVQWYGPTGKWRAMIRVNNKRISLGYYATPEEAHQKYLEAKPIYHTH